MCLNRCLKLIMAVLAVLPILAIACAPDSQRETLTQNQRLWARQAINSYRYQLQVSCFCPTEVTSPVAVEVHDGTVNSVIYIADGRLAESKYFEKYDTVDELFSVIDEALKRKADELRVSYDEKLGFPTSIYIDYVKPAVDDEIAFTLSEFQALQ